MYSSSRFLLFLFLSSLQEVNMYIYLSFLFLSCSSLFFLLLFLDGYVCCAIFPESIILRDDEMYSEQRRSRAHLSPSFAFSLSLYVDDVENKWLADRRIDVDGILRGLISDIFFRQSFVYLLGRYTNKNTSWHIWWRRDQDGCGEHQSLSLSLSLAFFCY